MANIISGGSVVTPAVVPWGGLTFRELQDTVYFMLDEAESSIFPRSIVRRYVNLGIAEVARFFVKTQTRQTFSTAIGEAQYPLDTPVVEMGDARVDSVRVDGRVLPQVDPDGMSSLSTLGTPAYWYVTGTSVYVVPVPDSAGLPIEVEYVKAPHIMEDDDDSVDLPPDAVELACLYAAYKMKLKDDEYGTADRYKALYDDGLLRLVGPRTGFYD